MKNPDEKNVKGIRKTHRKSGGPLIVFVGRLVYEKGVDDLLHATKIIGNYFPHVKTLIVGEGQMADQLKNMARQLGICDLVDFVGWVDPEEVTDYLAAADCFVGPSKKSPDGRVEGQGLTFLEAMNAETPVIATSIGGIKDSVQHEKSGLLVPENSPRDIADSVLRLAGNTELTELLINGGKEVVSKFSRESSAGEFSKIFESQLRT